MENKVYCRKCYHCSIRGNCHHSHNVRYEDTPTKRVKHFKYAVDIINKGNSCLWYEKGDRYSLWNTFLRMIGIKESI